MSGMTTGVVQMLQLNCKGPVMTGFQDYLLLEVIIHLLNNSYKITMDRNVVFIVPHRKTLTLVL